MKDIFIDNCLSSNFTNPVKQSFKDLIRWLITFNQNKDDAFLVVSNALIKEYISSSRNTQITTSLPVIVDKLTRENRLNKISNSEIKDFKRKYYTKKVIKKLNSNSEDREHIPVVLLSNRKIALTDDVNFTKDLINFSGFKCTVVDSPEKVDYKNL